MSVRKLANDQNNDSLPDRNYGGGIAHLGLVREVFYYLADGAAPGSEVAPAQPQLMRQENGGTPEVIAGVGNIRATLAVQNDALYATTIDGQVVQVGTAGNGAAASVPPVERFFWRQVQ